MSLEARPFDRRNQRLAVLAWLFAVFAAFAMPVPAQPRVPLVAVLMHGTEGALRSRFDALREGLKDLGYREGQNLRMEVRWSDNRAEQLPRLARELLDLKPDVAVANLVVSAQALHRESKSIPIVLSGGAGAQRVGLVASLGRPGGNVTGITNQGEELTAKLFELLQEIAPEARRVMVLSSGLAAVEPETRAASRAAAKAYGRTLIEAYAESSAQLAPLAARCAREGCEALVALLDPNMVNFRDEVIALAAALRIPAAYPINEFAVHGGLISYSADPVHLSRRAATYVDKILKGARPGDLPIERPTKFELSVNRKTAAALGLRIPASILVRADQVIE